MLYASPVAEWCNLCCASAYLQCTLYQVGREILYNTDVWLRCCLANHSLCSGLSLLDASFICVMSQHRGVPCQVNVDSSAQKLLLADLEEVLLWTLLNSGVALVGYWLAAAVVDNPKIGRLRLQLLGFAADAILFYISAAIYPSLTSKKGLPSFQFIYFFSSFWGQFGPNCTTFLLAGVSPPALSLVFFPPPLPPPLTVLLSV